MTKEQAVKLAAKLETAVGVPEWIIAMVSEEGDRIVFCSELTGEHSLDLASSDRARVLAHWKGFLANQPSA